MAEQTIYLIAGLGNPGDAYSSTRHNAGFMVIDHIASSCSLEMSRTKFNAKYGTGVIAGKKVILVKPMAFMNRSGYPVFSLAKYFKIETKHILIVHDDMDIDVGKLKIKKKGGDGGHKGLRSLIGSFGSKEFCRLRFGIGHAKSHHDAAGYVLGKFSPQEKPIVEKAVAGSEKVILSILSDGVDAAMNSFNGRNDF